MSIQPIKMRPGVNTTYTPTLNEGGWSASNLIRFVGGLPERVGGWVKYYNASIGSAIRALWMWRDFNGNNRLAVGATSSLSVITNSALTDITPQTKTTSFAPNMTTTSGSAIVTITDAGISNVTAFDAVYFNVPIAVGGLVLSGLYQITTVTGATSYQITAASNATATVVTGTITGITQANPAVVTANAHGHANGDLVYITGVAGMTEVNGRIFTVAGATANTFQLSGVNSTGYTAYSSGGFVYGGIVPQYATTSGSSTVTVTLPAHGLSAGGRFVAPISTTIGGATISGSYTVVTAPTSSTFTITASNAATSTATGTMGVYTISGTVPTFTTSNGTSTVTVTLTSHGLIAGSTFTASIPTTVGGVTVYGTYTVVSAPTANTFTITVSGTASSTTTVTMITGYAQLVYYISLGPAASGAGYGIGTYGGGAYGVGVSGTAQTGTAITATDWTLSNWGQTLIACPDGGGLYYWDPSGGFTTASLISTSNAPIFNAGAFVSQPSNFLIAYGSSTRRDTSAIGVVQDPLLVRWSGQDNYTLWSIDTTNQVGSTRLSRGSRIVGGIQGPNVCFLWTDVGVWTMTYIGYPLVFSVVEAGQGCGLVAKHAATVLNERVFWMGRQNFYTLGGGGGVRALDCPVWDDVFQDLDTSNADKCWAWSVSSYQEVWFFYPTLSDSSGQCSSYAKMVLEGEQMFWDIGEMPRSAGIDLGVISYPIAGTSGGIVYEHENGNSADGQTIDAYIESGDVMISSGEAVMFVDQVRPDMKYTQAGSSTSASMDVTITAENDVTGEVQEAGPLAYNSSTLYVEPRVRGHRVRFKIESDDTQSWWRLGLMRYRAAPDGKQ